MSESNPGRGDLVVGVDTSPTARRAALRAAELAAASGVGLHLAMSVESVALKVAPQAAAYGAIEAVGPSLPELVEEGEAYLRELCQELPVDGVTTHVAAVGPVDLLCSAAAERPGSTIVVGNRRVQGMSRVLGSVADGVIARAPGDVLVVQSTRETSGGRALVVGVDRSETSKVAATRAAAWASALGVQLHLLTCVERSRTVDVTVGGDRFHTDWLGEARQYLTDLTRQLDHGDIASTIEEGKPGRALCSTADEIGAGMIVVGNRRVRGASRVLGSVARDALHHAGCDVLVVDSVSG